MAQDQYTAGQTNITIDEIYPPIMQGAHGFKQDELHQKIIWVFTNQEYMIL